MSISYIPANFSSKDGLPQGHPDKILSGVDFDNEFSAIASAFLLASPKVSPTFTGTLTADTVSVASTLTALNVTATNTINAADVQTSSLTSYGPVTGTNLNVANWDEAYGWGNHASAGYLTSFTETDPTVPAHVKSITTTQKSNWDEAHSWGDHDIEGYMRRTATTFDSELRVLHDGGAQSAFSDIDFKFDASTSTVKSVNANFSSTVTALNLTATSNVSGAAVSGNSITSYGPMTGSGDLTIGTNILFADVSAQSVGIGTATPATGTTLHVKDVSGGNCVVKFENGGASFTTLLDLGNGYLIDARDNESRLLLSANATDFAIAEGGYITMPTRGSAPTGTFYGGEVYYDTALNKLRCHNGTSWQNMF